uniref:Uncharacterized protein n=1 Tax=Amorphochlora amoebiformis TaxID=1561963 RepID=A0A7S0DKP2_9EUKA|mmetsp:Transcript_32426/g.52249  ORF Transcript_32426/g.52249 Transcript_32426/m.52249 type:complete len:200 (+) Transcript_32426:23-622(+)
MPIDAEAPIPDLPNNSKLRQQRLDGWQPIATPKNTVATLSAIGMAFLIIGSVLVSSNGEIEETDIRYDNIQSCKENVTSGGVVCNVTLNFNEDMKNDNGPLRFSYSLSNFFQASRRYVKSRSAWQLADVPGTTSICEPLENFDNGTKSKRLYPCGWVANSFFNDTFKGYFCPSGGQSCEILSGSAWKQSVFDLTTHTRG